MRRTEYRCNDIAIRNEILDQVPYGYLALDGPMIRPMNFARLGKHVYFHGAVRGERAEALEGGGTDACFVADQPLASVPSTWRHPEMACPATTYYRSVMARGRLEVVGALEEKAAALDAMMRKYQPEGGYRPIRADDRMYRGPLEAVMVMRLSLESALCKVKVGQNLEPAARARVFEKLLERNAPGDYEAARQMASLFPELAAAVFPRADGELVAVDDPSRIPIEQLVAMMEATYWAKDRDAAFVRRLLLGSTVVLGLLRGEQLVAFARAVSDGAMHGWIYDVIVREDARGAGLGTRMMTMLLAHPKLARVRKLHLSTREMMPFYRKLGFRDVATWRTEAWEKTEMTLERASSLTSSGR